MGDQRQVLAVDCGNTQIKLGVFRGAELAANFRLATDPHKTSDEYAILLRALLTDEGLAPREFDGAVLASVVPPVQPLLVRAVSKVLGRPCLEVTAAIGHPWRAAPKTDRRRALCRFTDSPIHRFTPLSGCART